MCAGVATYVSMALVAFVPPARHHRLGASREKLWFLVGFPTSCGGFLKFCGTLEPLDEETLQGSSTTLASLAGHQGQALIYGSRRNEHLGDVQVAENEGYLDLSCLFRSATIIFWRFAPAQPRWKRAKGSRRRNSHKQGKEVTC